MERLHATTKSLRKLSCPTHSVAHLSPSPPPSSKASRRTIRSSLPSPTRFQSHSDLFPPWLLSRKDFQDLSHQYGSLESIDVWSVCTRPAHLRNKLEKRAVLVWMTDSPFLAEIKDYQLADVCDRFKSVAFAAKEVMIRKGDAADCMYLLVEGHVGIYINTEKLVDCVYPKNVIGEVGVQTRALRSATVAAMVPVKAFKLTLEDYEIAVFKIKLQHFKDQSLFLHSTQYFSAWDKVKVDRLATALMVKAYRKGQIIFRPGETPHDMYVVREGQVHLEAETTLEKTNKWPKSPTAMEISRVQKVYMRTLRECRVGDVFGDADLFEGLSRSHVAICTEASLLYIIRKELLDEIFTEKEKQRLRLNNETRPLSSQIRRELEDEHTQALLLRNALLNGLDPSPNPLTFSTKTIRRQRLMQTIALRYNKLKRNKLIRQDKVLQVVGRAS